MYFEFLVEELSMEIVLREIIPKIIGSKHTFNIRNFQNKDRLLKRLPERMKSYAKYVNKDWIIVVLIDRDNDNCYELKKKLCKASSVITQATVLNRIVIEELEAWFFGDIPAICNEYQRIPLSLSNKKQFRNPDAIKGGTWEQLNQVLKKYGYDTGLQKREFAQRVAIHMNIDNNKSKSFQILRDSLRKIIRNTDNC